MWCWRGAVATAEAKKAGSASEAARSIPKPPSHMGRLAWIHWVSDRFEFVITFIPVRWISSNTSNKGLSWQDEHRRMCISRGALNDELKSVRAS